MAAELQNQNADETLSSKQSTDTGTEHDEENISKEQESVKTDQPIKVRLKDGAEITLDELKNGYLRQSDYTRKTQEVAELRKQLSDPKNIVKMVLENEELLNEVKKHLTDDDEVINLLSDDDPANRVLKKIYSENKRIGEMLKEYYTKSEQAVLEAEIAKYEAQHPELKTEIGQRVIVELLENVNDQVTIDELMRAAVEETKRIENSIIESWKQRQKEKQGTPDTHQSSGGEKRETAKSLTEFFLKRRLRQ